MIHVTHPLLAPDTVSLSQHLPKPSWHVSTPGEMMEEPVDSPQTLIEIILSDILSYFSNETEELDAFIYVFQLKKKKQSYITERWFLLLISSWKLLVTVWNSFSFERPCRSLYPSRGSFYSTFLFLIEVIVGLQFCVNFCYTVKVILAIYIYIYNFFYIIFYYDLL